tara:strand:- start:5 stop:232 length:228 start_codon:yes stop_codon:yes gene_type:complete
MFLIEYDEGKYIDGEKLDYIHLSNRCVQFSLSGDKTLYEVDNGMAGIFVNNLQAINDNPSGMEAKLKELQESHYD